MSLKLWLKVVTTEYTILRLKELNGYAIPAIVLIGSRSHMGITVRSMMEQTVITVGMTVGATVKADMQKKSLCTITLFSILLLTGCSNAEPSVSQATGAPATNISFVSGMGCNESSCTDPSHHHDCPTDCEEYDHHHHCDLDCTDPAHNHHGGGHTESGHHFGHD